MLWGNDLASLVYEGGGTASAVTEGAIAHCVGDVVLLRKTTGGGEPPPYGTAFRL